MVVLRPGAKESGLGESGGGIYAKPSSGTRANEVIKTKDAAVAEYDVQIGKPGTYWVWLRGYAEDKNSNSVYIKMARKDLGRAFHKGNGRDQWIRSDKSFTVKSEGSYNLQIFSREPNFEFDRLIVSTEKSK